MMLDSKFLLGLQFCETCILVFLFVFLEIGLSENCVCNFLTGEYRRRNDKT